VLGESGFLLAFEVAAFADFGFAYAPALTAYGVISGSARDRSAPGSPAGAGRLTLGLVGLG
jgi:hypothetical protein